MKLVLKLVGYALAIPLIVVLIVVMASSGAGDNKSVATPINEGVELVKAVQAAAPEHWYALKDGQQYAYEAEGESELVSIRYLGAAEGVHKIILVESQHAVTMMECREGCEFVKAYQFWGRELQGETIHKMTFGTILWEVFQDAWNGKLERYRNDEGEYLWADRDGPRWIAP